MSLSDRILVMYEGEIVGELDPKKTTVEELGLYMAGAKRMAKRGGGRMKKEHFLQSEGFKTVAASVLSILIGSPSAASSF